MKWTTHSRRIDQFTWHRWFAWYPVRIHVDFTGRYTERGNEVITTKRWAWLEHVERLGLFIHVYREYKAPQ